MPIFYRFRDITTYWSKISVLCCYCPDQSRLKPPQGLPWDLGYETRYQKARLPGEPDIENRMIVGFLVLSQCQRVTDRQTDGRTRHAVAQQNRTT